LIDIKPRCTASPTVIAPLPAFQPGVILRNRRGLPGAVGAITADNAARRQLGRWAVRSKGDRYTIGPGTSKLDTF